MALVLDDDQLMLRDTAGRFLAERAPIAQLRRLRDEHDELGYSAQLWQEMATMGWPGIAIPEKFGGLGMGYTELGIVLEQVGRNLSASPLEASALVGATAVAELGTEAQKESLLPAVAGGELTFALALQEGSRHQPRKTAMSALKQSDGWVLQGRKVLVFDGHTADKMIVVARTAGRPGDETGLSVFVVDADTDGVLVERVVMVDSRNSANVSFDGVEVGPDGLLGSEGGAYAPLQRVLDIANVGMAAELLGLSAEAFERTLEYLKVREQFGVPIGSFQALQHRAAKMYAELELARSIVLTSLQAIDGADDSLSALASACKAKLCEVATLVTAEAIQMHGGIGMTDEADIGLFIKRARVAQQTYGDYSYHLDRFARLNSY
ncbi:MAG: acyl-CoA dehydrogenase family protein [Acidimicrobiales bacterium]